MNRQPYHHGELREALLSAARQLLERETIEQVTLRGIARDCGVSPAAPFRHFASRQHLLEFLVAQGFNDLADELERTAKVFGVKALAELGQTYVRFAMANRRLFSLMFSVDYSVSTQVPLAAARERAYAPLRAAVLASVGAQGKSDEVSAWALVHGLAVLATQGQLGGMNSEPEALAQLIQSVTADFTRRLAFGAGAIEVRSQ